MRITIKDIARKAGVSHATVSRALNGHPAIPETTAAPIRRLALEMGYLPSAAARGLKTNRSHVVGVIANRFDDPYFAEVLSGIEHVLRQNGYSLFVASFDQRQDSARDVVRALAEHQVDGVLFVSIAFQSAYADLLAQYELPFALINNQSTEGWHFTVAHDDLAGSRQVVRHLLELGHQRIAYLGNATAGKTNADRLAGFNLEMASAANPAADSVVVNLPGGGIEAGAQGARALLRLDPHPTAVFCFNDLMAIGALRELQGAGVAIPAEMAIAGFDNIPFAALTNPPLTTFDQPKQQIGAAAASLLLEQLSQDGAAQPQQRILCGALRVRESTMGSPLVGQASVLTASSDKP